MDKKYYAIIVGGGSGLRMNSPVPKQFLPLNGKPVVMHTIEAFHFSDLRPEIILVLPVDFHPYWEKLCARNDFNLPHTLVKSGPHRFYSVKNGLKHVKKDSVVAIHDAVRPLAENSMITTAYREAEIYGNAVAAIKSTDSLRQIHAGDSLALDRDEIRLVQTPQTFKSSSIKKAYLQDYRNEFTDDASVAEKAGNRIHLVEGNRKNIKITFPEDISLAEFFLDLKRKGPDTDPGL